MRYQPKLTYQFLLLASIALLVVLGLGLFDLSDRAQTDTIILEQERLLEVKRQLARVELEILNARLTEAQMLGMRKLSLRPTYNEHVDRVDSLVSDLRQGRREGEIAQILEVLGETARRYRKSVQASLSVQRKMGFADQSGQLVQLRALQDSIQHCFQQFDASQLTFQFSKLLLLEKDFSNTLNMKLADQLLVQATDLEVAIRGQDIPREIAATLLAKLNQYRNLATQLISSTVEFELAVADNTLQFNRISPNIARCQNEIDRLLAANTGRLLEQRSTSFLRTVGLLGAGLLLIAFLVFFQIRSARTLAMRLGQLAEGMREVAAGHFAKITELPQGRDEVGQLGATFKTMAAQIQSQILTIQQEREKAEIANRVKSQFLATMSHEIRTPLNAVMGMLELLESTDLTEEQKGYASVSRASAEALLTLLQDILDLSRIEAEKLALERVPFSLQATIGQAVALFAPIAREKGLAFDFFVDPQIPPRLMGDANRIRQILANLVGNAIKFTEEGQVKIALQRVGDDPKTAELHFLVQDTGPGLSGEFRERLFEPFTQADASITRRYGGSGLGLSICARLVELMGGRIWVESEEGKGSSFFFSLTLDIAGAEADLAEAEANSGLDRELAIRLPLSILLVDDIDTNRQVALEGLARMGYQVEVAANGFEAVERAQKQPYDLIFMDIQMPGMDGIEAARIILSATDSEHRPRIIAVSGHALEKDREACLAAGLVDFLIKPFKMQELQSMVEKWGV
jgi:signal transduction histidine kinase